jgi:hydrogenase nickel incorporation protein HypA/HybF
MHEFHLINDLMTKIKGIAQEHNAIGVAMVKVRLGALAHISADHFREHFEEAAKGTVAEQARLEIEVLTDESDPLAQDIMLESVELEQ